MVLGEKNFTSIYNKCIWGLIAEKIETLFSEFLIFLLEGLMTFVIVLSIIAVVISTLWVILEQSFESIASLVASIIAVISLFLIEKRKKKQVTQNQEISNKSFGVQAGGNITINDNGRDIIDDKKTR